MVKIAFIGAGSKGFARTVITDILTFPAMRKDTQMALMDINESRLDYNLKMLNTYKENNPKELENVTFEATTDQKAAITDAKYVVSAFMVGGWHSYKIDLDIPFKYGVTQNVGDTLGPGGIFRFLRNVPVYRQIIENMKDVSLQESAFKPFHLNYTNPMVMNTWFCNALWADSTVGLCHGVQGTATQLRMYVGAMPNEFSYLCAGINHMGWFLDIRYKDATNP
ncbi:MAG TPA: alpha-glucosidase/alpha-galactosidase, partial [Candidatus Lokiarchaeia archaeon]|nr:alpha-glucosidase/alpha-galactosidase [Candidatus Lokiarchaeia archaeon]